MANAIIESRMYTRLTSLGLVGNSIGYAGGQALAGAVSRSFALKSVSLPPELRPIVHLDDELSYVHTRLELLPFLFDRTSHSRGFSVVRFVQSDGDHAISSRVLRFIFRANQ